MGVTEEEMPCWEDVTTIIAIDNDGITYSMTKEQLLKLMKKELSEMLPQLWEQLCESE